MKHLLSMRDLDRTAIEEIFNITDSCVEIMGRDISKVPTLRGKMIVNVFFEDSTRTRMSFEAAGKRLSADVLNFSANTSAVNKGESMRDTAMTIDAMGVDALIVRHGSSGAPAQIAGWVDASVINAGDGWHEHPTQSLLDLYTLDQERGSIDGAKVAIVGDINHSRVARSNALGFSTMGAQVTLVAPPTMLPADLTSWPVKVSHDLDAILHEIDVLYLLRIQNERMNDSLFPSVREYANRFGLTASRAKELKPDTVVMHPGPINRGVEIDGAAADAASSLILKQVATGVPLRMAVLYRLLGAGGNLA